MTQLELFDMYVVMEGRREPFPMDLLQVVRECELWGMNAVLYFDEDLRDLAGVVSKTGKVVIL